MTPLTNEGASQMFQNASVAVVNQTWLTHRINALSMSRQTPIHDQGCMSFD